MIITHIIGGLGNQLFQYAAARRLSLITQQPLKLDTRAFATYRLHQYSLDHFNIQAKVATANEIKQFSGRLQVPSKLRSFLPDFLFPYERYLVREQGFSLNQNVLTRTGSTYLEGYWQSEQYFVDVSDTIREDLTVITPPTPQNAAALKQIGGTKNATSLHIRRGDYVSNQTANQTHGTCTLQYYQRAATHIAKHCRSKPTFFVFSDDPSWVRDNLSLEYPMVFMSHNDAAHNYEDLRLMSACTHHIIANSTFSWWGAWLGKSETGITIAPDPWFRDSSRDTHDLIPKNWLKVAN